ncbi:hypothetical protein [Tardiphaga alba]|uniref:hypothetical protein n=1 Tax=Tardiphaga alba TaxID=340268 RepID=UPI001BAC37BF|nr:hypothetical protein [Tardiphaga alba]
MGTLPPSRFARWRTSRFAYPTGHRQHLEVLQITGVEIGICAGYRFIVQAIRSTRHRLGWHGLPDMRWRVARF